MTESTKCPNCHLIAKGDEIKEKFGYREINGKTKVQSWCRICRSGKEVEAKEDPLVIKKIALEVKELALKLDDKESVIDLFTNPKGLNFRYTGEDLSTIGWSKQAQRIVKDYDISPARIAEHAD